MGVDADGVVLCQGKYLLHSLQVFAHGFAYDNAAVTIYYQWANIIQLDLIFTILRIYEKLVTYLLHY